MARPSTALLKQQPPKVTGAETRTEILMRARRTVVPLRKTFVQKPQGETPRHGPLMTFVTGGDLRGLRAYLIVVAATSAEHDDGWTTGLDSAAWARLYDTDLHATPAAARTAAWRTMDRLQDRGLILTTRKRGSKKIAVTLLREDGTGKAYTRPNGATVEDRFIRIPRLFWIRGYDTQLDMPALAMLLTVAHAKPWSPLPAEHMQDWYGWSADTTLRGLKKLPELKLVERRESYKRTPSPPPARPSSTSTGSSAGCGPSAGSTGRTAFLRTDGIGVSTALPATLSITGATPLFGRLLAPGLPWQATSTVTIVAMVLIVIRDLVIETHLHQEVSLLAAHAAPDAPMSEVAQAVSVVRRPPRRRRHDGGTRKRRNQSPPSTRVSRNEPFPI